MVKKGFAINIMSAGLIVLGGIIMYAIFHPVSQPHLQEYTKTDIYMMKNAIDSSKLYLHASFEYSVYQGVYDTAKNGGFNKTVINRWEKVLEEGEFVSNVKTEILKNMDSYTYTDYRFLDLHSVRLPQYKEKDIELAESDGGIGVYFSGGVISVSKRDEQEVIVLESSLSMGKIYEIDLFGMYDKARQFYNQVRNSCESFSDADVGKERETHEGDFEITQKVLSLDKTATSCKGEVRVSITEEDPREFPVFNGTDVSFEPVSFEFLVEIT